MSKDLQFRFSALALLLLMKGIRNRTQSRYGRRTITDSLGGDLADSVVLLTVGTINSLSIVIYALTPSWISWADACLPYWLRWIGVGLCVASVLLVLWCDRHLGRNFSRELRIRSEHYIVETGPYRWVRHPIYSSGILFLVGVFLVTSNYFVGLCWSGLLVFYALRIPKEEAMMVGAFGDTYTEYANRTGRLLPKRGGGRTHDRTKP